MVDGGRGRGIIEVLKSSHEVLVLIITPPFLRISFFMLPGSGLYVKAHSLRGHLNWVGCGYCVIFVRVLFSWISRVRTSQKFPLQFMSICSNENRSKIPKLSPHEFTHVVQTCKKYLCAKIMAYTVSRGSYVGSTSTVFFQDPCVLCLANITLHCSYGDRFFVSAVTIALARSSWTEVRWWSVGGGVGRR